jgi:uncharacterized protein (TIGR02453 family)
LASERFVGFPEAGIDFFLQLQAEQSRTWFKAHQQEFEQLWKRPMELFVSELQERLVAVFPGLADVDPHYFRIQRDTRFAKDKSPYKTNLAASVSLRPVEDRGDEIHGVPGLYFSFGLEADYIGVGSWHMTPEILRRYREAVDDEKSGAQLQKSVDALRARGFGIEAMEKLKRTPPPYAQDHPRAELLKHKGLAVGIEVPEGLTHSRELLDWSEEQLRAAKTVVNWLDRYLS